MSKINIQVSRDTHRKLMEIGRKGQSFDDIVNDCIIAYNNHNLMEEYHFPLRVEGEMNLQYGTVSIPKKIRGKKVKDIDIIDCFHYLLEQNDCEFE